MLLVLTSLVPFSGITVSEYARDDYQGSEWTKTRNAVLGAHKKKGIWYCKYSGVPCSTKSKVDIDHIIPLKYAHDHGAYAFIASKKKSFANDTLNLVETSLHENRSKGDKGPSLYMPAQNKCFYAERWFAVSKKYKIKLDKKDSVMLLQTKKNCK
jgi:hypothetical protein